MKRPLIIKEIKNYGRGFISTSEAKELLSYVEQLESKDNSVLPNDFPTQTKDINGDIVSLGDKVVYDYKGESNGYFIVVFEDNAFRKKYPKWDESIIKPMLELGQRSIKMRILIAKKYCTIENT